MLQKRINTKGKTVLLGSLSSASLLLLTVWFSSITDSHDRRRFSYNFVGMIIQLSSHKYQEISILSSAKESAKKQVVLQNLKLLSINTVF